MAEGTDNSNDTNDTNGATPEDRYREVLFLRTKEDRYPSMHLLDRIEACLQTQEQIDDYVNLLVDKMHETHYPSGGMMDRIQRFTCKRERV